MSPLSPLNPQDVFFDPVWDPIHAPLHSPMCPLDHWGPPRSSPWPPGAPMCPFEPLGFPEELPGLQDLQFQQCLKPKMEWAFVRNRWMATFHGTLPETSFLKSSACNVLRCEEYFFRYFLPFSVGVLCWLAFENVKLAWKALHIQFKSQLRCILMAEKRKINDFQESHWCIALMLHIWNVAKGTTGPRVESLNKIDKITR